MEEQKMDKWIWKKGRIETESGRPVMSAEHGASGDTWIEISDVARELMLTAVNNHEALTKRVRELEEALKDLHDATLAYVRLEGDALPPEQEAEIGVLLNCALVGAEGCFMDLDPETMLKPFKPITPEMQTHLSNLRADDEQARNME